LLPRTAPVNSASADSAAALVAEAFDPFDLTDPFPFYRRARREAPVFYAPKVDSWVVARSAFRSSLSVPAIARMVQGIEVDLFRPDEEVKKLARLAVDSGVDDAPMTGSVDQALAAVAGKPNGKAWLDAWKAAQYPWFNCTSGGLLLV
jgi:hypothetical protein